MSAEGASASSTSGSSASFVSREFRSLGRWVGGALAISGFTAMGLEIVYFRFLGSVLGDMRFVFSLLLMVILVGMWLGAVVGGSLAQRVRSPLRLFAVAQCLLAVSTVGLFLTYDPDFKITRGLTERYAESGVAVQWLAELWYKLRPIVWIAGIPSLCMGASYPLANAAVQTRRATIGTQAGALYLWNTLGAVCGASLAGFVLLPGVGLTMSVTALVLGLPLSIMLLALAERSDSVGGLALRGGWATYGGLAFVAGVSLVGWVTMERDTLALKGFSEAERQARFITVSEGLTESIAIIDEGTNGQGVALYTNGHLMSGTADNARRYMRSFAHIPLLQMEAPRDVLVICFGVGNTVHAASLHPVERIEVADLSAHVLEHAPFFREWNQDVLEVLHAVLAVERADEHGPQLPHCRGHGGGVVRHVRQNLQNLLVHVVSVGAEHLPHDGHQRRLELRVHVGQRGEGFEDGGYRA